MKKMPSWILSHAATRLAPPRYMMNVAQHDHIDLEMEMGMILDFVLLL
jgi:hypothetical protein